MDSAAVENPDEPLRAVYLFPGVGNCSPEWFMFLVLHYKFLLILLAFCILIWEETLAKQVKFIGIRGDPLSILPTLERESKEFNQIMLLFFFLLFKCINVVVKVEQFSNSVGVGFNEILPRL